MPLLLPFIKLDVNDWLTSHKIEMMDLPQIGAYIMLLTKCWRQDTCTLPGEPEALKKLSKWHDEKHGDFGPVLACFAPLKKTGRVTNPRLYQEWMTAKQRTEILSESGQRGAQKRWAVKPPRQKRESVPPVDWLVTLKANPAYAHISIDQELGKMDAWLSTRPGRHKTKQFIVKWLNRIEKPLSNGHGQSLICDKHPHLTFPDLKAKQTHDTLYHPKYVG